MAKSGGVWNGLLRIYIGLYFLYSVHSKLSPVFFSNLKDQLISFSNNDPLWFYDAFLRYFAIPNSFIVALLIVAGELFAGIFLTAGFITRVAAFAAILLNLNYLLAMYWMGPAVLGVNLTFLMCELVIIFTDAGKSIGLDGLF